MADPSLPAAQLELLESRSPQLRALLADLESESPTRQELPSVDVWGSYFNCDCQDGECQHREEWHWEVRLRLLTAIGRCRTLRKIHLNPQWRRGYSLRQHEALALFSGLQHNPVLEELNLFAYKGFGTAAACLQTLAAVIHTTCGSLEFLGLQSVGLSAEGLGDIAAALGRNVSSSVLARLSLCGNDIGNAVGAQHLAHILKSSPKLRNLWMSNIGMDEEGAVVIAEALAQTTTLTGIRMGNPAPRNPNQPAPMFLVPLLQALVWKSPADPPAVSGNHSITQLVLECAGGQEAVEPGLGEALAGVLRTNRALKVVRLPSFFVTRGLGALRDNSSITKLLVFHTRLSEDGDMDPILATILDECKTVQEVQIRFDKPFGPSSFTKAFFQGLLQKNGSIKKLVLDDWDGLDDEMFEDLIQSLSTNPNSDLKLDQISIKGTSWEKAGKGQRLEKALGDARVQPQLRALLADLESDSPTRQELPSVDLWGSFFNCDCQDGECQHREGWHWEVRLRLLTAIGRCSTLRKVHLNPLWKRGYSVKQKEAMVLFSGLQHNPVLRELNLYGYKGFGTAAACLQALTAVIDRTCSSLDFLGLQSVGLSAEGLGAIAAALGRNESSVLTRLSLCGNDIGNAVGAQHLAHILANSPKLRSIWMSRIGMDEEGAVVIAQALAHTTTLTGLRIGDPSSRNPSQPAPMFLVPLLQALVWNSPADPPAVPGNHSITQLVLECPGGQEAVEPGLGEALAGVLRTNRALKDLTLPSFFVKRGLGALRENSSITDLVVFHSGPSEDDDMDPVLTAILDECKTVREVQIRFDKPFGPSSFTKAFFQGFLQKNRSIKKLVLDAWDGLDDEMFEDLIQSLSTNPNTNLRLEHISIKGTSWEKQGKGQRLEKALREALRMQPQLRALLADLESDSPTRQELPSEDLWGSYFNCDCQDGECKHREEWHWEVRLRLLTAMGKCSTLKKIHVNPLWKRGHSVRQDEALALFSGLQHNLVLEELNLFAYKGFGTAEACLQALAAVIDRTCGSLEFLGLQSVGLSAEGLGHIAAALGRNVSSSVLSRLSLCGNDIGNAVGAQHLAQFLTNSPKLRNLWMSNIGMDEEGAKVIAHALAHTTTVTALRIGDPAPRKPNQPAPMFLVPLLQALVWHTAADPAAVSGNRSITRLVLECPGGQEAVEPGLGEALARVLSTNRALNDLRLPSFFVTRGLGALRENSSITKLLVFHSGLSEDDDMDPVLTTILDECKSVQEVQIRFDKPFGPSSFTKAFFQGLLQKKNGSIKRLMLDGWDGLDDEMFEDLIQSLSTNTNTNLRLDHISIKDTSWEKQGKGQRLDKALGDARVQPQLRALLAELESESPVLQELPSVDLWGSYFDCLCQDAYSECQHRGQWQWDVRLRLFTAIGKCRSLRKIHLNPPGRTGTYSVREVEALALLSGLQHNLVLEELNLLGYVGFGTAPCLQALTAVLKRSYFSLDLLGLQYLGLTAEGLGVIAAALGRNGSSVLSRLSLCGNDIGNAVGAQHLAHIVSNSITLRNLWMSNIGMDEEGAVLIAGALANTTTLSSLRIGDRARRNPQQPAPMFIVPILQALVWHSEDQEGENPPASRAPSNRSIRLLLVECPGGQQAVEPGLGEALARVLRTNRALTDLRLASFFVTRGLEGLRENSSITELQISHTRHSEDDDMDPVLMTILQESKTVHELQLQFSKPFGPPKFSKAFFQGLRDNRSIKTLVLDDCEGLDEYMFQNLRRSLLGRNCNNVLEKISIKNTTWESEGKEIFIQNALSRNISRRSAARQGSDEVPPPVTATVASAGEAAGAAVPEELSALLAKLDSPSPPLSRLPRVEAFGRLFKKDVEHPKVELELRLRVMKAIGKCSTLRFIDLDPLGRRKYKMTVAEAKALLEGLSSNAILERLDLSGFLGFETGEVCAAIAAILQSSRTLQYLNMGYTGMTADGLGCIAPALRHNRSTVLRTLYLSGNTTVGEGVGAQHLADILTSTPALRTLGMWDIGMDEAGAVMIGDALAQNSTLDWLNIGFNQAWRPKQAGMIATLVARAFTPGMLDADQEAQGVAPKPLSVNESVTHLRLEVWGAGQQPVNAELGGAVARMLRSNMTLRHLDLCSCFISQGLEGLCDNSSIIRVTVRHGSSSHNEDYYKLMPILQRCQAVESLQLAQDGLGPSGSSDLPKTFFQELQNNRYLKRLVLDGWKGLDDDMFQDLLRALQVNTNLESISFENTVWKSQGKGAAVDEVLRQNKEYRKALAGAPTMPVKSCRLVLCGFPYAGKTTIRNTLMGMQTHDNDTEIEGETISKDIPRTLGFEVKVIKDAPALRITVWDLAGHREFHALHDFVFPTVNSSSLFLFVYNPFKFGGDYSSKEMKDRISFREEFVYWLKFIASNARLAQQVKPYVHVVVTFGDKLEGTMSSVAIREEMEMVKKRFKAVVETSHEPTFINGQSWTDVYALRSHIEEKLGQLVSKLAPIPNICEQTRIDVQRWAESQQGMPLVTTKRFSELFLSTCKVAIEHPYISKGYRRFLRDFMEKEDSWKVVASYLKDSGEIIYFQMSGLMVINLQWLGMGVFGQLISIFGEPDNRRDWLQIQNGFISKYGLSSLLKMSLKKVGLDETIVTEEQFIELMLELHLCYESRDEEGHVRYFVPICTYKEEDVKGVDQQLKWPLHSDDLHDYIFTGLRLQCDDQDCTFLTPGFFPRLQVFLYSYCLSKRWVDEERPFDSGMKLQPNVLLISAESLDIFVEFSAEVGCYIDILARSTQGYLESLSFLKEHIVSQIRSFCASYEGCAGVTLVEGVLRQECVASLTLCRYRKHECILTDKLVKEVAAAKDRRYAHYTQSWRAIFDSSTQGQALILRANKEYATVVDGHVILGQKEDLAKAEAEFQGSKSSSSFSGETPVQLSPQVSKVVQREQHIAGSSYPNHSVEAGKRRGLAVIVSMEVDRAGGSVDRGRLEALFGTLGFDTDILVNGSESVKARFKSVAKLPTLAKDDCFLCCINAHGGIEDDGRQYILISGARQEKVYVDDDILKPISESTWLRDKPKVFLINACRGTGSLITSNKAGDSEAESSQIVRRRSGEVRLLHSVKDCLIFFSTSHGQQSFRDPEKGTNFISALMKAIIQGSRRRDDVYSILTSVIAEVTEIEVRLPSEPGRRADKRSQCPEMYSTLTRKLCWSSP